MSAESLPLQVDGLTVEYGDRTALRAVTFGARPGELVALTGPNGSGKTTLLRCALGLIEPTGGSIRLFGESTSSLTIRERARRVAWVPQDESPRDNIRVSEYVLYGRYSHLPPFSGETREDRRLAAQALQEVALEDRADSGVLELSGGERQRLLLARALAQESPLLLLDEPTAHLDIGHQLDLLGRVRRLVVEHRACAVAALHDLNLAARFADRVVVLSHGRLVADGRPGDVLDGPLLRSVWGVEAERKRDSRTGETYLVPYRPAAFPTTPASRPARGPIHVVGGGGASSPVVHRLWEEGWSVTMGVVPMLDSDTETAEGLGLPFVAELPFAPVGPEARARNRILLDAARAIVVGPVAFGPTNVANLEDLVGRPARTPTWFLDTLAWRSREFTGGVATALRERLFQDGADAVASVDELVERLATVAPAPSTTPPSSR